MTDLQFSSEIEVKLIDSMGGDKSIINAARVSYLGDKIQGYDPGEVNGLINFLMSHKHGTPFEHGSMTFFVSAPIFVFREFHRHRVGFSYNEESGRYKQLEPKFYLPNETRPLKQEGKAGAYTFILGNSFDHEVINTAIREASIVAYGNYENMLEEGIAKEVARMVLPVNIYSSMYVTCNPRSLMNFLELRTADQAMYEIRQVANKMQEIFRQLFPVVGQAFTYNGSIAP